MNDSNALEKKTTIPDKLPTGALTPQPQGGALRNGGSNSGGPGAPPSVVRERSRSSFYKLIPRLEKIAGSEDAENRDVIRAIDTLGRYGLMTGRLDLEEVRARLHRTIAKIEELCDPDTASRVLSAIDPIWNPRKG